MDSLVFMKSLFILFYETRSLTLRNELVQLNIGLARKVAHQMERTSTQSYEDLEAWAIIGLVKGVERFNPFQNPYFSSFALPYIRGEIQHFIRDKSTTIRLSRKYQDLASKRESANKKLSIQLGRRPTKIELIKALDITEEEYEELEIAVSNRKGQANLDARIGDGDELTLGEALPAKQFINYSYYDNLWDEVEEALSAMDCPMTLQAIRLIYLDDYSFEQAVRILKISEYEVFTHVEKGVELLTKKINVSLEEIVNLVATYPEDSIKNAWHKANISDYAEAQFYDFLNCA